MNQFPLFVDALQVFGWTIRTVSPLSTCCCPYRLSFRARRKKEVSFSTRWVRWEITRVGRRGLAVWSGRGRLVFMTKPAAPSKRRLAVSGDGASHLNISVKDRADWFKQSSLGRTVNCDS